MDEITNHTHKITRSILNPKNSVSNKMTEIILEILIITFAVSLSQFLERKREQNLRQKEVKQFLLGLRKDMIEDRDQVKDNIAEYNNFKISYSYLSNAKTNRDLNTDSLNEYVELVKTSTKLIPNVSRFEGFKSSGKLEDITDEPLLQNILYYYEQDLPSLSLSQTGWKNYLKIAWRILVKNRVYSYQVKVNVTDPAGNVHTQDAACLPLAAEANSPIMGHLIIQYFE
jgi:hypothetical protein